MTTDAPEPASDDLLQELFEARKDRNPGFAQVVEASRRQRALVRRLTERRKARGLSQADVARLMGTRQPAVARLEGFQNEALLSTLSRYAAAVGCEIKLDLVDVVIYPAIDRFDEGQDSQRPSVDLTVTDPVRIELASPEGSDGEVVGIVHVAVGAPDATLDVTDYVEVHSDDDAALYVKVERPVAFTSRYHAGAGRTSLDDSMVEVVDDQDQRVYLAVDRLS